MKIFEDFTSKGNVLPLENVRLFSDLNSTTLSELSTAQTQEIFKLADETLEQEIPLLPVSLYLDFSITGNRFRFEDQYNISRDMLSYLMVAEAIDDKGKYIPKIADCVIAILEETSWVIPAHSRTPCPSDFSDEVTFVDLFSASTAGLLCMTAHLVGEKLNLYFNNQIITKRIQYEVHRRIIMPIMKHDDFFWMQMEPNNWNPWIISNVLLSLTYCEQDLCFREQIMEKLLMLIDRFVDHHGMDGGCNEGPGYWNAAGGSLFDCLETIYDLTGGAINKFSEQIVKNIGNYIMDVHISNDYFVTFADCPARLQACYPMIVRYAARTKNTDLFDFASTKINPQGEMGIRGGTHHRMSYRYIKNILTFSKIKPSSSYAPKENVFMKDLQVIVCRRKNFFFSMKGGHNAESHNHNDIGNFIVYYKEAPLFIDAGVDTYTKKTFSPQRYELWYMNSNYHNLPTFNGIIQKCGKNYFAITTDTDVDKGYIELELVNAYPENTGLQSYVRRAIVNEDTIEIEEIIDSSAPVNLELHYLFSEKPDITRHGYIYFPNGAFAVYDKRFESIAIDEISTLDQENKQGLMSKCWEKDHLYRLTLQTVTKVKDSFLLTISHLS